MTQEGLRMTVEADKEISARIERLADGILELTDQAGAEDNMTVAEIIGVLELCKASVIEKAFEVVTI